jgi:phage protein U
VRFRSKDARQTLGLGEGALELDGGEKPPLAAMPALSAEQLASLTETASTGQPV